MPDLPPEKASDNRTDIPSSECCLGSSDIDETVAVSRNDLTMEQLRFAEAIGQALVGAWRRESASVVAISYTAANQRATEANA